MIFPGFGLCHKSRHKLFGTTQHYAFQPGGAKKDGHHRRPARPAPEMGQSGSIWDRTVLLRRKIGYLCHWR